MRRLMQMTNSKVILDEICRIALDPQYKDQPDLLMRKLAFCVIVKDYRENKKTIMGPTKGVTAALELLRIIERWRVYQNDHTEYVDTVHTILMKYNSRLVYRSCEEVAPQGDVVVDQDTMRIIRDALQCAAALCDTPIARRRLGIDPQDDRLQHVRAGLSELQSREHLFPGEAQKQVVSGHEDVFGIRKSD